MKSPRSSFSPIHRVCMMAGLAMAPLVPSYGAFVPSEPSNSPTGTAVGAKPGRVAWAFNPKAATWDGTTTSTTGWWSDSNTHPEVVAKMLADVIHSVGGADDSRTAWENMFRDLNQRRGKGAVGYKAGQKIAIKLNLNQCREHGNNANASYIAPQLVQALLAELVKTVGASPKDITFYDACRRVPSTIFEPSTRDFPGVHFVDSVGGDGREKAVPDRSKPLYLGTSTEPLYFPTCVTEADYEINVAGLKGHTMAGMTVCAKNHLGTVFYPNGSAAARELHQYIAVTGGRAGAQAPGEYNGLVDLNGHQEIGGKTVLYLVDALYATKHNEYRLDPSAKWQSAPFNGNWTSSLLASQDELAVDSVALDFLRNEPTLDAIVKGAVDNYMHEAALAGTPQAKRTYDPERDGTTLKSLGVHEHWNNAEQKQYSRNLGKPTGIELVQIKA